MDRLIRAIAEMREAEALDITRSMLDADVDPLSVLECGYQAMAIVGRRFENGEYFLPELMLSAQLLLQISDLTKPLLKADSAPAKHGRVLMGTVAGDIHNIGKDMVTFLLDVNGFEVRDLGVDVSPDHFVEVISEFRPQVVGMSGLLTVAYDSMRETVAAIREAGLRDSVKIMIGGGQVSERIVSFAEADAFGKTAMDGVALAKQWTSSQERKDDG